MDIAPEGHYDPDINVFNSTLIACLDPVVRCAGMNLCSGLYSNAPQCLSCANGYYRRGRGCSECPEATWLYAILTLMFCFGVVLLLMKFARSGTHYMTSIGVGFNFFQVVAIFATFDLGWRPVVLAIFQAATITNMNVGLFPLDCLTEEAGVKNYQIKWLIKLLLPLIFLVFFLVVFFLRYGWLSLQFHLSQKKLEKERESRKGEEKMYNEFNEVVVKASLADTRLAEIAARKTKLIWITRNAYLSFLVLIYITLNLTALEVFDCNPPDGTGLSIHKLTYEPCYGDPGEKDFLVVVGWLAMMVYGLGIPVFIVHALLSRRALLHTEEAVLKYGLVFRKYKSIAYLWEIAILFRKMLIVITKVLGISDKFKVSIVAALCLISLCGHVAVSPYQAHRVNWLESFSLVAVGIIALCGVVFFHSENDPDELRVFDVPDIGTTVVVVVFVLTSVLVVSLIMYDLVHAHRMKGRNLIGMFANEDVQVFQHFFASGLSNGTRGNYVSTTDHFNNIVIRYGNPREVGYKVSLKMDIKDERDMFLSRFGRGARNKFEGTLNLQHDLVHRAFVINALIPRPGKYVLKLSGGKDKEIGGGCLSNAEKIHLGEWDRRRWLMDYYFVVTKPTLKSQQFVDMEECYKSRIVVYEPVQKFLQIGQTYPFRIGVHECFAIKVILPNGVEVQLSRDQHNTKMFVADVKVKTEGNILVLADIPMDNLATMGSVSQGRDVDIDGDGIPDYQERTILLYRGVDLTSGKIEDLSEVAERAAPKLGDDTAQTAKPAPAVRVVRPAPPEETPMRAAPTTPILEDGDIELELPVASGESSSEEQPHRVAPK